MSKFQSSTKSSVSTAERFLRYRCDSGVEIIRCAQSVEYKHAVSELTQRLDTSLGVLLASSYEYPGRYQRWDIGFVNPPISFEAHGRLLTVKALNKRGLILLPEIERALHRCEDVEECSRAAAGQIDEGIESGEPFSLQVRIQEPHGLVAEEMRSRRPTVFSALRAVIAHFRSSQDSFLGLFGAFGYDLTFQFEDIERQQARGEQDRDLVLFLPDEILVADHRAETAISYRYDFVCRPSRDSSETERFSETTGGFARSGSRVDYVPSRKMASNCDHAPGEFAAKVKLALDSFQRGELFEVVPGQMFSEPCHDSPSMVFERLKKNNPAPYGALMNLGRGEYLIAASPEMFVRVRGNRVETCPISGTIKRGADAIEDAVQIKALLNSSKDEAELSMCTDVDRNDKARICVPGSVEIIGRRQIEIYSRLIHTVDHVVGTLRADRDALDAFLAHTWAVTVTGAPKLSAMQFIEDNEASQRHWYGGAMGQLGFDGNVNTGLTLRTIRVKNGIAEVRAGATLLIDSDPIEEEAETRLKASALLAAIRGDRSAAEKFPEDCPAKAGGQDQKRPTVLMVDHKDSFVHNLASYFKECGADVTTLRSAAARDSLRRVESRELEPPDLLILSPGPGSPSQFGIVDTLALAEALSIPVFGVCLGLQGMVEYFGGTLTLSGAPMHGKASTLTHDSSALFAGIGNPFVAGRYHSLVVNELPSCLRVTARSEDGTVMAVEHESLAMAAVQFHPESIMTLAEGTGKKLVANVLATLLGGKAWKRGLPNH